MKRLILSAALALVISLTAPPLAQLVNASFLVSEASASKRTTSKRAKRQRYASAHSHVVSSARRHGVPVSFALRVAKQESGVQCGRWGDRGKSGGPLQIYWPTARTMFGVRSFKRFRSMSCAALTDMGMRHLALAYRSARGNLWLSAKRHNAGIGSTAKSRHGRGYANAVVGGDKKQKRKNRRRA